MDQLRLTRQAQLVNRAQQAGCKLLALFPGTVFLQPEVAQALLEAVDQFQERRDELPGRLTSARPARVEVEGFLAQRRDPRADGPLPETPGCATQGVLGYHRLEGDA